jgi:Carboxypeptidase regulatory-like domain
LHSECIPDTKPVKGLVHMRFRYLRLIAFFVVTVGAACVQAQTARISGKVLDPQGAVVPKAPIQAINQETKSKLEATSDENGNYTIPYLPAGSYQILVHLPGFADFDTYVSLGMGQALEFDIPLSLTSTKTEVNVEENPITRVETQTSELTGTITGTEVPALGLNGRNFTQLATLVAGVSNQTGQDEARVGVAGSVSFSINGGRTEYNSFQVDGSETLNVGMHKDKTSLIVTPSIDAIQEIKIVTSNYNAIYPSVGSGTTIVTTKSGTDHFHGSLYEFFRNQFMNAKGYFDVGNRPPLYNRNDFGGTIGGPIDIPHVYNGKGKSFFFFSEEVRRESDPYAYRQAVPSVAERQGDFSDVCPAILPGEPGTVYFRRAQYPDCPTITSAAQAATLGGLTATFPNNVIPTNRNPLLILGTGVIPLPNATSGCSSSVGSCYDADVSLPTHWREELFRIDHAFTDTLRANFHYIHDAWNTTTPVPQFAFIQNSFPTIQNSFYGPGISLVGRVTKTLSASLLNELVLSYTDQKITLTDVPGANVTLQGSDLLGAAGVGMTTIFNNGSGGKIPGIVIAGNNQAYGGKGFAVDPAYMPWEHTNPLYSLSDNVTKIYGKHSIQAGVYGVNFQRNQTNGSIGSATGDTQGILTFSNILGSNTTGNSVADFLSGQSIASFQQDSGQGRYRQRYYILEPYIQDDFKVSSHLTLNLGLRLSLFGNYHEANNLAYNWVASAYSAAEGATVTVGSQGQLIDKVTGQSIEMNPNYPQLSLDPRVLNGIAQCGHNGVPSSCMSSHLFNPAPRIGFAWSPGDGRTAIRGGYGLFFEHGTADESNTGSLEGGAPLVLDMTQANPAGYGSIGIAPDGQSLAFPLNVTSIPTKTVWPYVQQWSLSAERELPQQMLASIAYVGSKGTHLPVQLQINQLQPLPANENPYAAHQPLLVSGFNPITALNPAYTNGGDCNGVLPNGNVVSGPTLTNLLVACYGVGQLATNPNALREFAPGIGQVYSLQNAANSAYNALQFSLRRTKAPLVLGVAYTYSHSIDDASDRSDASAVNSLDLASSRASSSFDQRHLLNVSYVYDLPPLSKWLYSCEAEDSDSEKTVCVTEENSAVSRFLFKGWQLSGVTTFQTGTPFTVINIGSPDGISTQDNAGVANGSGAGSYPDLCGDPYASVPRGGDNLQSFGPLMLNPGAFCAPRGLTFGDAGRNDLRNPVRFNTDIAFLKHWIVKEGSSVEFRAEIFNLFNNTQFRIYDPTLGNQANNTVNCYGGLGAGYSAGGGDGTDCLTGSAFLHPVSAHRPRTGQLGLKWIF